MYFLALHFFVCFRFDFAVCIFQLFVDLCLSFSSYEQALHDALMRQEELLAYLDRQEQAKFRVS